jgi:hypothetical protein
MGFNENAFIIAGTAIAIFGVGLYIFDTRKESVVNTYNQYRQLGGGSRRHRRKNKKTRKNY